MVVLFTPLAIQALSLLLGIQISDIHGTVMDLHAILHIPKEESGELRLHHPSFRDFLVNATRCDQESLRVDEKAAHKLLLISCLRLLSAALKENICDLDSPRILLTEVEESHIQQSITPAVQYACLYWVQHLQRSGIEVYDRDLVDTFVREHLLHWLEALCWMGKAAESVQAVTCLQSIASVRLPEAFDLNTYGLSDRRSYRLIPALYSTNTLKTSNAMCITVIQRWSLRLANCISVH